MKRHCRNRHNGRRGPATLAVSRCYQRHAEFSKTGQQITFTFHQVNGRAQFGARTTLLVKYRRPFFHGEDLHQQQNQEALLAIRPECCWRSGSATTTDIHPAGGFVTAVASNTSALFFAAVKTVTAAGQGLFKGITIDEVIHIFPLLTGRLHRVKIDIPVCRPDISGQPAAG